MARSVIDSTPLSSQRTTIRTSLLWAVALPFFLLPGPLTIEAQDIYGGFRLHIRIALGLLFVGGIVGFLRGYRGPYLESHPRARLLAQSAGSVLGLAGLALALVFGAVLAGEYISSVIERSPGGGRSEGRFWLPSLPYGLAASIFVVTAAGTAAARSAVLAALSALGLGTVLIQIASIRVSPFLASKLEVGVAAALLTFGLVWRVAFRRISIPETASARLLALLIGLLAGVVAVDSLLVPGAAEPERFQLGLTFGLIALAVHVVSFRALRWGLASSSTGSVSRPFSKASIGQLIFVVAFLVAARESIAFAGYLSESWMSILRPSGLLAPSSAAATIPEILVFLWMLATLPGALILDSGQQFRRWLGGVSLVWVAIVLWRVRLLLSPDVGSISWWAPAVLCLLLALACPWLLSTPRSERIPVEWGFALLCGLVGPVAAVYLWSGLTLQVPPIGLLSFVGCVSFVALGWGALRLITVSSIDLTTKLGCLVLVAVARVLPIHIGIAIGLDPGRSGLSLLIVLLGWALFLRRRGFGPSHSWLPSLVAFWMFFYFSFGSVTLFKAGPSQAVCEEVLESTPARVMLRRFDESRDYEALEPYDVLPVPGQQAVLVSFKRIDRQGGFFELLDSESPEKRSRLRTVLSSTGADSERTNSERNDSLSGKGASGDRPFWPERLELNAENGLVYAQLLGNEDYAIWELEVAAGDADEAPQLTVLRRLPIPWEPGNPAIDTARDRLILSYVPNRTADNPLLESIELDSLSVAGRTPTRTARLQMADFAAVDPSSGNYYVPAFFDSLRFQLVEVDGDTLSIRRKRETYFPSVGLAADGAADRIYLTNVMAGSIVALSQEDLSIQQALPAGRFPRDLVLDRARDRLVVAGYGDGVVRAYSTKEGRLRALQEVRVGPLLRGLGLNPETGAVYAASACGVFDLSPVLDPSTEDGTE